MMTVTPTQPAAASYRPVRIPERHTLVERRADGTLILRSATPPPDIAERSFADFIPAWAAQRGNRPAFRERDAHGDWRSLSWADLWRQVQLVGAALLGLGLDQDQPLMLLSGNSIEQAVLLLAAEYVGVPTAPVSPAYSTVSKDFARLLGVATLVPPAALFVQETGPYERALAALSSATTTVIAVQGVRPGVIAWADLIAEDLTPQQIAKVAAAHAAIRADDTARVLFTSGSTGTPKGVALTYGNFRAVAAYYADNLGWLRETEPVFLDWLPWHHGLGGVLNLGRSIQFGAAHHIDDGRPLPGMIERTVRNLRDVSPTIFTSVPSAWTVLAGELERDPELAQKLFANVHYFGYGGASLPRDVWQRIQQVAEQTIGQRIAFCTGLACTETSGMGTYCGRANAENGNIGTPVPGAEVKLVPLEGGDARYEIRMRGPHVFGGYVAHPELTAAAFDDDGFFRLGDAVRLALLECCSSLLTDAVICGHDHDYLAALAWPNVAACRKLAPELATLDAAALVQHPIVVDAISKCLRSQANSGSSLRIERLMLMAEPPSIDANEIADKGYVNQSVTRARRAHFVEQLFQTSPAAHIARAQ